MKNIEFELSPTALEPSSNAVAGLEAGSREKLCEVAIQLFAKRGLEGVSTRDLAGAAGVNISLISYYFGGKEGLYREVLRSFAETAQGQLSSLLASYKEEDLTRESYVRLMSDLARSMVLFKSASPQMSELMMREMLSGLPYAREVCETIFDAMCTRVTGMMSVAQTRGILRPDLNVHLLFYTMIHAVDCYFMALRCDAPVTKRCGDLSKEQVIEHVIKIFVEGVLA